MNWYRLSIRSRMFIVLSLLLLMSTAVSITKQSMTTFDSALSQLKSDTLPAQLQSLASQISTEILPSVTASKIMTNDPFIEEWIKNGSDETMLPLIEKKLASTKEMLGSDFTFLVVDSANGNEYLGYGDSFSRTLLKDYRFKDFYPKFLATGKEYELSMDETEDGSFMLYINYRSSAINDNSNHVQSSS